MSENNYNVFIIKAKNNYDIAHISLKQKLYHVAISRFYYSIYQKMLYVLYTESVYINYDENRVCSDVYSDFRGLVNKKYVNILGAFDMLNIKRFPKLKKFRKEADYSFILIDEATYNSNFREIYLDYNKIVDKIIKKLEVANIE